MAQDCLFGCDCGFDYDVTNLVIFYANTYSLFFHLIKECSGMSHPIMQIESY